MREEIAFVTDIHRLHTTYYRLHTHTQTIFPHIQIYINDTKRPFGWKQPTGLIMHVFKTINIYNTLIRTLCFKRTL